ncbi:hypothetical protein PIB30_014232 [Stylosanthes scabra]|uniref:Uncharacterized protein n=1 Tax=Stylosanthes scabra TaxID=79078 RepID=A0ABU6X5H3_9FABA|nr:hypothetical protein [Stylosanthes scabra]
MIKRVKEVWIKNGGLNFVDKLKKLSSGWNKQVFGTRQKALKVLGQTWYGRKEYWKVETNVEIKGAIRMNKEVRSFFKSLYTEKYGLWIIGFEASLVERIKPEDAKWIERMPTFEEIKDALTHNFISSQDENGLVPLTDKLDENNFVTRRKSILLTLRTQKLEDNLSATNIPPQIETIPNSKADFATKSSNTEVILKFRSHIFIVSSSARIQSLKTRHTDIHDSDCYNDHIVAFNVSD